MSRRTLTPEQARQLLYDWHGGQSSALYALASSGLCVNRGKLLAEVAANQMAAATLDDARDLARLYRYLETTLDHRPADRAPWRAAWAKPENRS